MIVKVGSIKIVMVEDLRTGIRKKGSSDEGKLWFEKEELKLGEVVEVVKDVYDVSGNVDDYVFVVGRAVTADVPNENLDAFSYMELMKMKEDGRFTYETFKLVPLLEEHDYSNIKRVAGGFVLDVYFDDVVDDDKHVITLVAVDRIKKKGFVDKLLRGDIGSFSMGCVCEQTRCSVCGHVAKSENEYCEHVKRKFITREAFEWCEGVWYRELSIVKNPADKKALSKEVCYWDKEGIKCL